MTPTITPTLKRLVARLGIDYSNGRCGLIVWMYALSVSFLIINSALFMNHNWDDLAKRLDGFKVLLQYLLHAIIFISSCTDWDKPKLLIQILEDFYEFPYRKSLERLNEISSARGDMMRMSKIWSFVLICVFTLCTLAPVAVFVLRTIQYDFKDITIEMLFSPFSFYYPKNYETIAVYFFARALQTFFLLYALWMTHVVFVASFSSMQVIRGELRLLRLSIEEIDHILHKDCKNISQERFLPNHCKCTHEEDTAAIQSFLVYFVKHHQYIYRKLNDVARAIKLTAFIMTSGMAVLMCTAIYNLVKTDKIMVKFQETSFLVVLLCSNYCFNIFGETILNEDENLRYTLYHFPWLNKPLWFKKSLHIILTRMNKPSEMKYAGLFSLSLKNFIMTLQATYTYFNVLNNLITRN